MIGYVYAIENSDGLVKIGWSSDPNRRLAKINSDTSSPCRMVGAIEGTREQESALHQLLSASSKHGEWFNKTADVRLFLGMLPEAPRPMRSSTGCMNPMPTIRKSILNVSQAELAAIAGTTQATISRWESGELHPDRSQMARIREAAMQRGRPWDDTWFFEAPAAEGEAR